MIPGHFWEFGHPGGFGWLPWLLFSALPTLFWLAGLILLAFILVNWLGPHLRPRMAAMVGPQPVEPPPFERLRQRYAAGEIDEATFAQMWERLQASYQPDRDPGD